jgi:hypothetical protein
MTGVLYGLANEGFNMLGLHAVVPEASVEPEL